MFDFLAHFALFASIRPLAIITFRPVYCAILAIRLLADITARPVYCLILLVLAAAG